ncbi:MoaD/ThiS family protein [Mycobacterium sp. 155]|uniref:MoaD/ThiS family protein n=1 Tax=Mycobacterium sp. 155 TaxID=1157943 RepID=UPI00036929CC|nr:MoaD/ThiS family protein [Mycobacterium sp. 155]
MAATVDVTVRYFAAAAAAAGVETETLGLESGTTIEELVARLGDGNDELARVLKRCSYLCDGVAVHDKTRAVTAPQTLDVLPPFAGG